ncbi:MAG: hypothetical protein ABI629_01815 [bacterium]
MTTSLRLHSLAACLLVLVSASAAGAQCAGNCNDDGSVSINELIVGVNIALGAAAVDTCAAFDLNGDGSVTINELIAAVNGALNGCPTTPRPEATSTATTAEATATEAPPPTATAVDTATTTPADTHSATATAVNTATTTAIATATAVNTNTATAVASETATAVVTSTAVHTATAPPTTVDTATPQATGTSAPATATAPPTATPTEVPATPTDTPTPTATPPAVTATFTVTATPTGGSSPAVCGNGFLEAGESCTSCAGDCTIGACTASATMNSFTVHFSAPLGTIPTTGSFLLGYHSTHVSLPGSATATSVRQRVTYPAPLPNVASVNDLDYALRLVVGRNGGLVNGLLATVKFDACQAAPAVTAADFGCTVEACAGAGGAIDGCACVVEAP